MAGADDSHHEAHTELAVEGSFPIDELVRRVAHLLSADATSGHGGQPNGAPTERTLRYYRTLGLLDPPLAHRGRTALYGPRHLLQAVAIKRLQAEGVPLGDIQHQLVGRDDRDLARIAAIDMQDDDVQDGDTQLVDRAHRRPAPASARSSAFWAATPATPPATAPAGTSRAAATPRSAPVAAGATDRDAAALAAIELAPGVHLSFPASRAPDADDRAAVTAAAHHLLDELDRLGFLPAGERRSATPDQQATRPGPPAGPNPPERRPR